MNKGQKPPRGYASINYVAKKCKDSGIDVNPGSIKFRFDKGEIAGIRELDGRKRRLVSILEIPDVILYFQKVQEVKNKKRSLCDLARDLGINEGTMYEIAKRREIHTARWGNLEVLSEAEYSTWKDLLKEEMNRDKELQKDYLTTGQIAKELGTTHHMVIYWIKIGKIPAEKKDNRYFISRKEFEEHGEDWKSTIESEKAERDEIRANYISRKELAKRWNTSADNIRYRIKTGKIPVINLDGRYFISRAEFEEHGEDWKKRLGF
jgi:hypothetical protein